MTLHARVPMDVKQAQLITERVGRQMALERNEETRAYHEGARPRVRHKAAALLVITLDGGRLQTRQDDPDEKWKEDKIAVVYDAVPVPGQADEKYQGPGPLTRSIVATMSEYDDLDRKSVV